MYRNMSCDMYRLFMTRLKSHSPPLSQYPGHLVDIFTHFFLSFPYNRERKKRKNLTLHFTVRSFFQACCQMQLSFEEKSVVAGLYLQKLCGHLVRDEIKGINERKKGKFVIVSLQFFSPTIVRPLNQITGQFLFW